MATRSRSSGAGLNVLVAVCAFVTVVLPAGIAVLVKAPQRPAGRELYVSLHVQSSGSVIRIPLEDYLVGVVAAEMPAAFEVEALKAQAVAARTYTLRRLSAAPGPADLPASHRGAVLCSDPGCCQAWKSREELLLQWGSTDYVKNVVKVVQAVRSTAGLALKHGGELIDSVYHACCGGATEHASEVWGRSVPYLVAVRCVCAEYGFAQVHTVSVKRSDLLAMTAPGLLQGAVPAMSGGVQVLSTTATNRAKTLSVFGAVVKATDLRKALALRSTAMTVTNSGDTVHFTTVGYGHGVGMCQWGAHAYALRGWSFQQILAHYYPGATLERVLSQNLGQ